MKILNSLDVREIMRVIVLIYEIVLEFEMNGSGENAVCVFNGFLFLQDIGLTELRKTRNCSV